MSNRVKYWFEKYENAGFCKTFHKKPPYTLSGGNPRA